MLFAVSARGSPLRQSRAPGRLTLRRCSAISTSAAHDPGIAYGKLRLIIVRHGRTPANREERFRGLLDVPLDDLGQAQALRTTTFIAETLGVNSSSLRAILSSPLSRAMDTARPLAERMGGLPVEVSGALNDVDVGRWEGVPIAEVAHRDPELWRVWCERPQEFGFPGGDNLSEVARRCLALLADLRLRHRDGGDVALFTHQVPAKLIVASVMGVGPAAFWRVRIDNAGVSLVEHDGRGYTLTMHNATAHLPR